MIEDSGVWLLGIQAMAIVVLVAAAGDGALALLSRARRLRHEKTAYRSSLQILEDRVQAARVRTATREDESLSWSGYRKFTVARKVAESAEICSLYLEPHDLKPIPSYRPGQYLTFSFRVPGERRPVVRCYSLSDSPRPDHFRISVKRLGSPASSPGAPPGKASTYIHEGVRAGDILDVRAPAGQFHLDLERARPVVLIGGGIGVTPVLSMLNAVAERGFDREVWLFYGVRTPDELILKDHLESLADAHPERLHVYVCYSRGDAEDLAAKTPLSCLAERVSVELFRRVLPSNNFEFYLCGPGPMMSAVTQGLRDWGVPDDDVFFEAFGPASVKATRVASTSAGAEVKVVFDRSGKEVKWDPSVASLLELADAHDVYIDRECTVGRCKTCETAIKSGEIDYATPPGATPEAKSCFPCIAFPKTDLVLDA